MPYADANIVVSVYMQAVPADGQAFDTTLLLVDEAEGTGNGLNGDRYRTYTNYQAAVDDQAAGYITTAVLARAQDFFAQPGSKHKLLIGRVDTGAGEVYANHATNGALEKVIAAGANFYGVTCDARTDTPILAIAAYCATDKRYLFAFTSADATWLTAGYPATLTALENNEYAIGNVYHDVATEAAELALLGNRLDYDLDDKAPGWSCNLATIADYTTAITAAQKALAEANEVNLIETWGNTQWLDPGLTCADRPIEHIVAVQWFKARLEEDLAALVQGKSAFGEKIPVSVKGQRTVLGVINRRLKLGIQAGHFLEVSSVDEDNKTYAEALTITTTDVTNRKLRFNVNVIWETSALQFQVDVYAQAS